ncbi:4Fe-4S binding protein [Anaeromyxobacter paludicola]|uniref:Electron transporter YccM n=1 Tax=Anaeromyxobacter paludicola TaxID=2918171 RepID=A0ABM7XA69_9BACT|nr:4Fe-4S binding protein [Anaeromyxobacter paludicola]BDG08715.1 electron transporter YccM [Anaeromyxobacter paludicola]
MQTPPPDMTDVNPTAAATEPDSAHPQADTASAAVAPPPAKKKPVRRKGDRAQVLRRAVQLAFLALNVWIGVQFYLFVRFFETGGASTWATRPAGVEGWLPIAGLMNLKALLLTGSMPELYPAGLVLFLAFLAISIVFRKAFCSWLCPVGTLSEALWKAGRRLLGRSFLLPRWLDLPLRGLKYLLLAFFLKTVFVDMPLFAVQAFFQNPYGLTLDLRMLDFFRHMGGTAAAVVGALAVASLLVPNFWCRYACPYGAFMGLAGWLSPLRIRRDPDPCIDCGKCAKVCPSRLPVDVKLNVLSPECTGCLECVSACPVQGALDLAAPVRRRVPAWVVAAGVAGLFLAFVGVAKLTGHWDGALPAEAWWDLVRTSAGAAHP